MSTSTSQLDYLIIGVLFGGTLSWLITHLYSKQSSRELRRSNERLHSDNQDLKKLVRKLPDNVRAALATDSRLTFTVDEIHSLVHRLRPRHLTDEQRTKLIEALRQIEPSPILVSAMSNDGEAQHYRDQMGQVFSAAGWPTSVRDSMAGGGVSDAAVFYYTGPISYPHVIPLPPPTALQIETAFASVGIALPVRSLEEFPPDDHRLQLAVGQKPTM